MSNMVVKYLLRKREYYAKAPYVDNEYLSNEFAEKTELDNDFRESFIRNSFFSQHNNESFFPLVIFSNVVDKMNYPVKFFACVIYDSLQKYADFVIEGVFSVDEIISNEKYIRDCEQILSVLQEDFCGLDAPLYNGENYAFFDADNATDISGEKPVETSISDPRTWFYFPDSFIKERLSKEDEYLEDPLYFIVTTKHWYNFDVGEFDLSECKDVILFTRDAYDDIKEKIKQLKTLNAPSIEECSVTEIPEEVKPVFVRREKIQYSIETFDDFVYNDTSHYSLTFDVYENNVRLVSAILSRNRFDKAIYRNEEMTGFEYYTEKAMQNSVVVYK